MFHSKTWQEEQKERNIPLFRSISELDKNVTATDFENGERRYTSAVAFVSPCMDGVAKSYSASLCGVRSFAPRLLLKTSIKKFKIRARKCFLL